MANSLELLLVEQILSNLTISKLKIDVVAKPTLSDNEDFFQRDVEAWELYYYQVISSNNLKDIYNFPIC